MKKIVILLLPLLLFAVLMLPYGMLNREVLVDWLGCGCPQVDENGNIYESSFNANDFTVLFWTFISLCATLASVLISARVIGEKIWLRIMYVDFIIAASAFISYLLCQSMMWN